MGHIGELPDPGHLKALQQRSSQQNHHAKRNDGLCAAILIARNVSDQDIGTNFMVAHMLMK